MLKALLRDNRSLFYMHFKEMDKDAAKAFFAKVVQSHQIVTSNLDRSSEKAVGSVGGHPFYLMMLGEQWDGKAPLKEIFEKLIRGPTGSIYLYTNYVLAEDLSKAQEGPILKRIAIATDSRCYHRRQCRKRMR